MKVSIHYKENSIPSVIRGELTEESKQALYELVKEVIGENDTEVRGTTQNPDNPNYWTKRTKYRNDLRHEQRQKAKEKLGMEDTKDE